MKTLMTGVCVAAVICLFVTRSFAMPVSALLEQGIYTEETVGDLPRAIEIYSEIVADEAANRKYVAEALFRKGRCLAEEGRESEAVAALEKLTAQYSDQKQLVEKALEIIRQYEPEPLFPELQGCRLLYKVTFHLKDSDKPYNGGKLSFYQMDLVEISSEVDPSLEDRIERFEFIKTPIKDGQEQTSYPVQHFPGSLRLKPAQSMELEEPGLYRCRLMGYQGNDVVSSYECMLEIKPALYSQLSVNEIQPNTDIRFTSAQHKPNMKKRTSSRGFINSDFVHIENMFDRDGKEIEFTEKHEGRIFRYHATLNEPVHVGETLFMGTAGTKESLVTRISNNDFRYRMNHTPGVNEDTHRVEIYRLPEGAKLLSTVPADLPHRVLEDGRVEILVDTVIPMSGSLLTEFRYRIGEASNKYLKQIAALKAEAGSPAAKDALEQIGSITENATFHHGALAELAKLVPSAKHNHRCIVKAAELVSKFGYHTGALVDVAGIAAGAEHECEELDEILELVVLKTGGTPLVVNLAKQAVGAGTDAEKKQLRNSIASMRETADFQTLEEALNDQASESTSQYEPIELQPAPWKSGDALHFRLVTKTGMEMGHLIWRVDEEEHTDKACWKVEQRLVIPSSGTIMASHVVAEKETFLPVSSRTAHQLGTVDATYLPGKVMLKNKGAGSPREVKVPEPVYDNEQVIFMMRRMPFAEGYTAAFPIMSVLSGASGLECRIRVLKQESIAISGESMDCWKTRIQVYFGGMKAVEQTAWFSVEDQVPVKFVTDQMDMELIEQTGGTPDAVVLKEHGATLHLPEGWFAYELPTVGKGSEIVRLLPPEMKLEAMLCKTVRQPAAITVAEIVGKDIEVLKSYFKNYMVRQDTVQEKEINGLSSKMFVADYEDQGKAKVECRAYYTIGSRVLWLVFRMPAGQFEGAKTEIKTVIEGVKVEE